MSASPWEQRHDEQGNSYYYNSTTDESSWEPPAELPRPTTSVVPMEMAGDRDIMDRVSQRSKFGWLTKKVVAATAVFILLLIIIVVVATGGGGPGQNKAEIFLEETSTGLFPDDDYVLVLNPDTIGVPVDDNGADSTNPVGTLPVADPDQATGLLNRIIRLIQSALGLESFTLTDARKIDLDDLTNLGDLPAQIKAMLLKTVANVIFTGKGEMLGMSDMQCSVVLFFQEGETEFTRETMEVAIQCRAKPNWDPATGIPALQGMGSWLEDFNFLDAMIAFSSAAYQSPDTSLISDFVSKGINIFALLSKHGDDPVLNNLEGLLDRPLSSVPSFAAQVSIPLQEGGSFTNIKLSSYEPVRGRLWLTYSGLSLLGGSDFTATSSGGVQVYIEGASSLGLTRINVATIVRLQFLGGNIVGDQSLKAEGAWDMATRELVLTAKMDAGSTWRPLPGKDASLLAFGQLTFRIIVATSSAATNSGLASVQRFRSDGRCGVSFPLPGQVRPGQCDPLSATPCCDKDGWCSGEANACTCPTCKDYRGDTEHQTPSALLPWSPDNRRCGAGFPAPGAQVGQCNPFVSGDSGPCCQPVVPMDSGTLNAGSGGFCGATAEFCQCDGCVDYSNPSSTSGLHEGPRFRADGKCGPAHPAPAAAVGECDPFAAAPWAGQSSPTGPCCSSGGQCSSSCGTGSVDYSLQANMHIGSHVMGHVWNKHASLCAAKGTVTIVHGVLCASGRVAWDRLVTPDSNDGTGGPCSYVKATMTNADEFLLDWMGSCDSAPRRFTELQFGPGQLTSQPWFYDPSTPPPPSFDFSSLATVSKEVVRADGKCGAANPAPGSSIGQCDPASQNPCCSLAAGDGVCGRSDDMCGGVGAVDYRRVGRSFPPGTSVKMSFPSTDNPRFGAQNTGSLVEYQGVVCDNGRLQWNRFDTYSLSISQQLQQPFAILKSGQLGDPLLGTACTFPPNGVPFLASPLPQQLGGLQDVSSITGKFQAFFEGSASVSYSGSNVFLKADGQINDEGLVVRVLRAPVGELVTLIRSVYADQASGVVDSLQRNVDFSRGTGYATLLLATKDATMPDGMRVVAGLTISVRDVNLLSGAFGGLGDGLMGAIAQVQQDWQARFNLEVYLPLFGGTNPWHFAFSVTDVALPGRTPAVMRYLTLTYVKQVDGPWSMAATAALSLDLIPPAAPVEMQAVVSYDDNSRVLSLNGVLTNWRIGGLDWMLLERLEITIVANLRANPPTYDVNAFADARLDFRAGQTAAFRCQVVLQEESMVLWAAGVGLGTQVHPSIGGVLAGEVDLFFTSLDQVFQTSETPSRSFLIKRGLTLVAAAAAVQPGALDNSLQVLYGTYNVADTPSAFFKVLGHLKLGPGISSKGKDGLLSRYGLEGARPEVLEIELTCPSLELASALTLRELQLTLVVQLATGDLRLASNDLSVELSSNLDVSLPAPINKDFTTYLAGKYERVAGLPYFSLYGILPAWNNPFGATWLNINEGQFLGVVAPNPVKGEAHTKVFSLTTSATFTAGDASLTLNACGLISNRGSAVAIDNVSVKSIAALVCEIIGFCDEEKLLEYIGVDDVIVGVTLASKQYKPEEWSGGINTNQPRRTLCAPRYGVPRAGLTVYGQALMKGPLNEKLKDFLDKRLDKLQADPKSANAWIFSINIPFSSGGQGAGRRLQAVDLDALMNFNIQQELHDIRFALIKERLWLTGIGITGKPIAAPPVFSAFIDMEMQLRDNPYPLRFHIEGSVSASAEVTLSGRMTSYGWINPFGIKGLVVRAVSLTIGFSPASPIGLSKIGMGFDMTIGRAIVTFEALLSIDSFLSSYARGSLSAAGAQALSLYDLAAAVRYWSNGIINVPDSWLPGPDILSLERAAFAIAGQAGQGLDGNYYDKGFYIACKGVIFGIEMDIDIGTVVRPSGYPDFQLNAIVNFDRLNEGIMYWIRKIIPFDWEDYLLDDTTNSLCDIACIKEFSIREFSIADTITLTNLPKFQLVVTLAGRDYAIGPSGFTAADIKQSISNFWDGLRRFFSLDFCVFDFNCPSGEECKRNKAFTCQPKNRRLLLAAQQEDAHAHDFKAIPEELAAFIQTHGGEHGQAYLAAHATHTEKLQAMERRTRATPKLQAVAPPAAQGSELQNPFRRLPGRNNEGVAWWNHEETAVSPFDPLAFANVSFFRQLRHRGSVHDVAGAATNLQKAFLLPARPTVSASRLARMPPMAGA